MGYSLLINEVYCGYNPLTNLLLTFWDIQVLPNFKKLVFFLLGVATPRLAFSEKMFGFIFGLRTTRREKNSVPF